MSEFNLSITVEVDQVGNGLAIQTPVRLNIAYGTGRWRASAATPIFEADEVESLDRAIILGARTAKCELQAAVIERPLIAGRITPEEVSRML